MPVFIYGDNGDNGDNDDNDNNDEPIKQVPNQIDNVALLLLLK